jgi:hypothetical protein
LIIFLGIVLNRIPRNHFFSFLRKGIFYGKLGQEFGIRLSGFYPFAWQSSLARVDRNLPGVSFVMQGLCVCVFEILSMWDSHSPQNKRGEAPVKRPSPLLF